MKIARDTKVAVDVRNLSSKEKENVVDAMESLGVIRVNAFKTIFQWGYISMNFQRSVIGGIMREGAVYHRNCVPVISYSEFMEAVGATSEKLDAYISGGNCLCYWEDGKIISNLSVLGAYQYNLMSEEEFKKKHAPQLRFKEWDVEVSENYIKIGCQMFKKSRVNLFLDLAKEITKERGAHGLSLDEVLGFLVNNKMNLGLYLCPDQ